MTDKRKTAAAAVALTLLLVVGVIAIALRPQREKTQQEWVAEKVAAVQAALESAPPEAQRVPLEHDERMVGPLSVAEAKRFIDEGEREKANRIAEARKKLASCEATARLVDVKHLQRFVDFEIGDCDREIARSKEQGVAPTSEVFAREQERRAVLVEARSLLYTGAPRETGIAVAEELLAFYECQVNVAPRGSLLNAVEAALAETQRNAQSIAEREADAREREKLVLNKIQNAEVDARAAQDGLERRRRLAFSKRMFTAEDHAKIYEPIKAASERIVKLHKEMAQVEMTLGTLNYEGVQNEKRMWVLRTALKSLGK